MADYYTATIANIRLWCSSIDTEAPRSLVPYAPARGDVTEIDDAGAGEVKTTAELLFVEMAGERPAIERFRALAALVAGGNPDEGFYFSHPIAGTGRVKIGEFRHTFTGGTLAATIGLTRVGDRAAVSPVGPAVSPDAGAEAVKVAADAADAELAAVGLTGASPAAAAAAAQRWADTDVAPRTVFTELGTESQRIEDEIASLDLVGDLDFWPAYKTLVNLRYALTSAADGATAEVADVFGFLVDTARPLRAIVASVYGARRAAETYGQVVSLNDVSNPARIPAGTTLLLPALAPAPRRA